MNRDIDESLLTKSENLNKTVWILAWPVIVEMLLMTLTGIVDMAMVGRLGPASIAAVGLGSQFVMLATTAFAAIRTGTTALVARHIGAKDPEGAHVIARQSVVMTFILAVSTLGIFFFLAEWGMNLLGAEEEVVLLGVWYIRLRTIGLAFSFFTMIFTSMLRGCGDTKTPMMINIIINVINPILNYGFIFGNLGMPQLGVAGAALATAIAQVVGFVLIARVILRGKSIIKLSFKDDYKLQIEPIKRILNIGIPAMVESVAMRISQIVFTMILTSLGTITYAAHQVAIRAESISFMPGWGFGVAATTLIGQNLGAQQYERAEKSGYVARNMALIFATIMGVLFFFFSKYFVMIFSDDPDVIDQASRALKLIAIAQPSTAINLVLSGALRGAGDTRWVTFITGTSVWVVRLTIAAFCVFVLEMGLIGAWLGMIADIFIRSILFSIRYAKGKWKYLKV